MLRWCCLMWLDFLALPCFKLWPFYLNEHTQFCKVQGILMLLTRVYLFFVLFWSKFNPPNLIWSRPFTSCWIFLLAVELPDASALTCSSGLPLEMIDRSQRTLVPYWHGTFLPLRVFWILRTPYQPRWSPGVKGDAVLPKVQPYKTMRRSDRTLLCT